MAGSRPESVTIFLDHASTTPVRPEVEAAMAAATRDAFANPSSQHAAGRRARHALEEARERIMATLGCRTTGPLRDRLVFTSGATEANRLAVLGMADGPAGAVATSARDHASLRSAAGALAHDHGWSLADIPLTAAGTIADAAVANWLDDASTAACRILSTTLVCGQTGTIEPPEALAPRPSPAGPLLVHTDATQAAAYGTIDFPALGVATLSLAPHKFGGPRGIGAVVARGDVSLHPLQPGPQETGQRGGTEAVPLAVGFATALELAAAERAAERRRLADLRSRFEAALLTRARASGVAAEVIGGQAVRSPHISTIGFPGHDRQAFVMAADLAGLCCATGTACASGSSEPAPALAAMRLPPALTRGAVRFSFGRTTTAADIDRSIHILGGLLRGA